MKKVRRNDTIEVEAVQHKGGDLTIYSFPPASFFCVLTKPMK